MRIEESSSARINGLYPGEISSVHSKSARRMLVAAGHSGRQFNPAMGRVLGSWVSISLFLSLSLSLCVRVCLCILLCMFVHDVCRGVCVNGCGCVGG